MQTRLPRTRSAPILPPPVRWICVTACALLMAGSARAQQSAGAGAFPARFEQLRATATPAQWYALLYDLPKGGDLHHHLGGDGLPEDWFAIATDPARNGGNAFYTRVRLAHYAPAEHGPAVLFQTIQKSAFDALPAGQREDYKAMAELSPEERAAWQSSVLLDRPGKGRDEFFEATWPRLGALLTDAHVLAELLAVNLRRFGAEGVRYIEAQALPFRELDHDGRPVDAEEVERIFEERLARPDVAATGVVPRFQYVVIRFLPDAEADVARAYAFLDKHRDFWVGINMAGREDRQIGHPSRFLPTYRQMRRTYSGINISIHAGETDEPDHHVRETLLLGATRIGHGVNLIDDPDTLLLMRQQQYLVEINLISNRLLEYVPDLTKHPFPEYLRFGIPVCLNTDDRGMWGSDMTDEYYTAVTLYHLTWPEIVALGRNSLAYGFMQPGQKQALLADYDRRVSAFEAKYARDDWSAALPAPGAVAHTFYAEHNFPGVFERR